MPSFRDPTNSNLEIKIKNKFKGIDLENKNIVIRTSKNNGKNYVFFNGEKIGLVEKVSGYIDKNNLDGTELCIKNTHKKLFPRHESYFEITAYIVNSSCERH